MSGARVVASLAGGLLLGLGVATIEAWAARQGAPLQFWGFPASPVIGLGTFGLLLAIPSRSRTLRRAAAIVLCAVLGLAALAVFWWLYAYRVPLWSLGAWLWLTAIGLAAGAFWALRRAVRT